MLDALRVAHRAPLTPARCAGMELDSASYARGGKLERSSVSPWELQSSGGASVKPEGKLLDSSLGDVSWHQQRRLFSHSSPTQPSDDSSGGASDVQCSSGAHGDTF